MVGCLALTCFPLNLSNILLATRMLAGNNNHEVSNGGIRVKNIRTEILWNN